MEHREHFQPSDSHTVARPSVKNWAEEVIKTFLPAIAIVLAVNVFLAQPRTVHGQSMEPNLHENQRVIVDLISLRFREPRREEIIILDLPERNAVPLIKRVVGLPGDTVEIKDGAVYLNGEELIEPYLNQDTRGDMPARIVPEGNVFVLGDNRARSNDSRYFGMVPFENIQGRAWLCYWPPSDAGLFN